MAAQLGGQFREYARARARGVRLPLPAPAGSVSAFAEFPTLVRDGVPVVEPREAIAWFETRLPMRSRTVDQLVAQSEHVARQAVDGLANSLQTLLHQSLTVALRDGVPTQEWAKGLNATFETLGLSAADPWRLETIARANLNTAYTAGRLDMLAVPEVAAAFPYLQFVTAGDSAVRPEHAAMEGHIAPSGDPIWQEWTPPVDWGCRCSLLPMGPEDLEAEGLSVSPHWPLLNGAPVHQEGGFVNAITALRAGQPFPGNVLA